MIIKILIRHLLLFTACYFVISLAEWEPNLNKWSNFGVIFFVLNYVVWSIGITLKTMYDHECE